MCIVGVFVSCATVVAREAFNVQVTVDESFEFPLQLFKVSTKDYRDAFQRSAVSKRDQDFLLNGQLLDFRHRFIRCIVQRGSLSEEKDWKALRDFDFSSVKFLDLRSYMEKTDFLAKPMRVAKSKTDIEREKGKPSKPSALIVRSVMGEVLNPFIDNGWTFIRYVSKEMIKHPTFKSDFVGVMKSFDYSVLFDLPRLQAVEWYTRLFQSLSSREWLATQLGKVKMTII